MLDGGLEVPRAQQAQRLRAPDVRVRGGDMLHDLLLSQPACVPQPSVLPSLHLALDSDLSRIVLDAMRPR